MAEKIYGGPSYEAMYMGNYGPLNPEYGSLFTGYRIPFERLATETWASAERAQVNEVTQRLSEGIKAVELKALSSDILERIPKGDVGGLKEIQQLGKLTGSDFILHGPHDIDPTGFTPQGKWSETSKTETETRLKNLMDRAHELSPEGTIPVVLHATVGIPASEWRPVKGKPEMQTLVVADRDTGAITGVDREVRLVPKEEEISPEHALKMKNTTEWSNQITSMAHFKTQADEAMERALPIAPIYNEIVEGTYKGPITTEEHAMMGQLGVGQQLYSDLDAHLAALYNRAYKVKLDEAGDDPKKIATFKDELVDIRNDFAKAGEMIREKPFKAPEVYRNLLLRLKKLEPNFYVPVEEFALKHAKENLAEAALYSYQKYGDKAPFLAVENFFPGTVFSRADKLSELIKASRKEFVERAKEAGYSERDARETAEKLIGATWDIGHIHMIRKMGFPKEKAIEETKKIAPFVKHVHISDNFGFEDSHLPPGMGEVPIKEMLKELEKAGFKGKAVLEAGGFVTQFRKSPTPYALEALGSPLYAAYMQPFWNQVRGAYGVPAGYDAGYGMMLPEQHFGIYGMGFSALPIELGGRALGKGQRFAGAPME